MNINSPVRFSERFTAVTDADEEVGSLHSCFGYLSHIKIFILYTEKQLVSSDLRGLGYVDSHNDVLEIKFDVPLKSSPHDPQPKRKVKPVEKTIEIELRQDKTALRSRKGDTGSVVWRARYYLPSNRSVPFFFLLTPFYQR